MTATTFTPNYHVSGGETDNYSTFEDFVPMTVKRRFGQNPVSHFRVLPLSNPVRFNPHSGRWESLLRIDCLTLWDHDSGLVGDCCGLGEFPGMEGTGSHELDGERSALLVSAPAACSEYGCAINTDPNAYSALSVFTSAHEDTFVDESMYDDFPGSPRLAGTHIDLWQSLSKHSTYTFDPDFFPILQIWFIGFIFIQIEIWFSDCGNNDPFWDEFFWDDPFPEMTCVDVYYAVLRIAVLFIFTCFVERFFEQGGTLSNIRINVGEPPGFGGGFGIAGGNPINGSSFILDNSARAFYLYNKLIEPLRFESLF